MLANIAWSLRQIQTLLSSDWMSVTSSIMWWASLGHLTAVNDHVLQVRGHSWEASFCCILGRVLCWERWHSNSVWTLLQFLLNICVQIYSVNIYIYIYCIYVCVCVCCHEHTQHQSEVKGQAGTRQQRKTFNNIFNLYWYSDTVTAAASLRLTCSPAGATTPENLLLHTPPVLAQTHLQQLDHTCSV